MDESRTTALGVWRFALDYLRAAQILRGARERELDLAIVIFQCACQGLELAFKAYLRAAGFTLARLRGVGHSLVACMKAAGENGLPSLSAHK